MTCVGCYAHTLVISAIGYTNCSLFSYIENTNLLPKQLFNFIILFFVYASIVLTSISMLSLSTKELVDVLITDIFM